MERLNHPIASFTDFQHFGINYLTGESCKLYMRGLFDLNRQGVDLVCSFLGISEDGMGGNWNSMVDGKPAIKSVMLPRSLYDDLARFVLSSVYRDPYVIKHHGTWQSVGEKELAHWHLTVDAIREMGYEVHTNPLYDGGTDRNTHAFTGRTV